MNEQSKALQLADELDRVAKWSDSEHWGTLNDAAAELRRLHEENETLKTCLFQMQEAAKQQYSKGLHDARDAITKHFSL